MRTIRLLVVTVVLGMSASILQAEEAYQLVKVWPEAPQGWHFFKPNGVAVDKSGNVYVGDSGNYRVKKFDPEGRFLTQWGSPGQGDGQFNTICSVKVDGSGIVYVFDTDFGKWAIQSDPEVHSLRAVRGGAGEEDAGRRHRSDCPLIWLSTTRGTSWYWLSITDRRPNLTYGVRIEKYSREGEFLSQWGAEAGSGDRQLQKPNAIAVDAEGNIYITEIANGRVQKFDSSGKFLTKWGVSWTVAGEGDGRLPRWCPQYSHRRRREISTSWISIPFRSSRRRENSLPAGRPRVKWRVAWPWTLTPTSM